MPEMTYLGVIVLTRALYRYLRNSSRSLPSQYYGTCTVHSQNDREPRQERKPAAVTIPVETLSSVASLSSQQLHPWCCLAIPLIILLRPSESSSSGSQGKNRTMPNQQLYSSPSSSLSPSQRLILSPTPIPTLDLNQKHLEPGPEEAWYDLPTRHSRK